MKNLLSISILCIFFNFVLVAQNQSEKLSKDICQLKDGRLQLVEKNSKGDTIVVGYLSSKKPEIRNGEFYFYNSAKKLEAKGYYTDDLPSGIWDYFDTNGNIIKTINYNRILEFLNSDTIKHKEVFLVVEKMPYFKGEGSDSTWNSDYMRSANNFKKYILSNMTYPIYAKKHNNTDRVFIQFVISTQGKVSNLKVLRSSGNLDLNIEALRVISESPLWIAGVQRDTVRDVSYTIPITFSDN